ncbi:MAG: hypothetical protein RL088_2963 [Verrucomicrobiota bacterium]|jgi:hypothetical protein
MITISKLKALSVAAVGLLIVAPVTALAVPTIRVSDGVNAPLLVVDESGGDLSSGMPGAVALAGIIYNGWTLDLVLGMSKPLTGSATAADFSLYASAISSGAGSLKIQFSDDNFSPILGGYSLSYGGETAATSSSAYKAYVDNTNILFGGSLLAGSIDSGAFSHNVSGSLAGAGPYSLTHEVQFTHTSASSSSISAGFVSVPDGGSTIGMLGSLFVAVSAVRRKIRF